VPSPNQKEDKDEAAIQALIEETRAHNKKVVETPPEKPDVK
jgi:hypothetical protein